MTATSSTASDPPGTEGWPAIVPQVLWFVLALTTLLLLRRRITRLIDSLTERVASGAPVRLGGVEIGAVPKATAGDHQSTHNPGLNRTADDGSMARRRDSAYNQARGIMLVHRIMRSNDPAQLYDALIYVVPRKGTTTLGVESVSYFFGKHWGHKVFTSADRSQGFPLVVSAYGPFLALARVKFADGEEAYVERFIDFEMGDVAPQTPRRGRARSTKVAGS